MRLRSDILSWSQQSGARSFDIEFADWLVRYNDHPRGANAAGSEEASEVMWFVIWLLSFQASQGHVCIDLGKPLDPGMLPDMLHGPLPSANDMLQQLRLSSLVGGAGDSTPLVLLSDRMLYLRRFFTLEKRLALDIAARRQDADGCFAQAAQRRQVGDIIARLFADRAEPDWQQVACANAILNRFSIIAGGPGTGKTTTVVRLLAALCELEGLGADSIRLVAPTGKAAMRLSQSVRDNRVRLHAQTGLGDTVPDAASTIHRLLRYSGRSQSFYFNRANPLPVRVVIVDEASMIDVSLMMALLDAIPADARIVLLGDQYQLASVEEGSVLAELCGDLSRHGYSPSHRQRLSDIVALPQDAMAAGTKGALDDCITVLRRSFRFGDDTQLGQLAQAINAGNADRALALLTASVPTQDAVLELHWAVSVASLQRDIVERAADHALQVIAARSVDAAFAAFHRSRVLCATREGPCGVEAINHLVVARINQLMHWQRRRIFAGLPILVLENDYENELFNGDTGIVVEHEGQLAVAFETGTVSGKQAFRYLALSRLPQWESAFAMTIHKSQGSEFENVLLVYPPTPLPLLTRELLYTGVTRSRKYLTVFAQETILRRSLQVTGVRQSGLAQLLAQSLDAA